MPEYPTNPKYNTRHYDDLVNLIKEVPLPYSSVGMEAVKRRVAERLADHLAKDNPQFDRKRFLEACGVEEEQA